MVVDIYRDGGWDEIVGSEASYDLDLRWMTVLDFVIGREGKPNKRRR